MVKKFTTNCSFGSQNSPVTLYIGEPVEGNHPLAFQSKWLSVERGGTIPQNIMDSFAKLAEISKETKVPFDDLANYVIDEVNRRNSLTSDIKKSTQIQESQNSKNDKKS